MQNERGALFDVVNEKLKIKNEELKITFFFSQQFVSPTTDSNGRSS